MIWKEYKAPGAVLERGWGLRLYDYIWDTNALSRALNALYSGDALFKTFEYDATFLRSKL